MADVAICFVLANPAADSRIATLESRTRALLRAVAPLKRVVASRFPATRRQGYGAGLRACVQSIRRRHRNIPPILVLRPAGQEVTLADVDEVRSFDMAPYAGLPFVSSYFGFEVYAKLEVFRLTGFERVVYLDCDTVVLDDISPLWDLSRYTDHDFHAVRETADQGIHDSRVLGTFNTGVMVLNRAMRSPDMHRRLLALAGAEASFDLGDQGVVNRLLGLPDAPSAGELDAGFNVLVRAKRLGRWTELEPRMRILHYVNRAKPWSLDHGTDWFFDRELYRIWLREYRPLSREPSPAAAAPGPRGPVAPAPDHPA